MGTKIEWTEETWNPIIGCSKVSPGCDNCYAERMACRLAHMDNRNYQDVTGSNSNRTWFDNWNGKTAFVESALEKPLHWKKPRRIFVCSMGDLFHESVPFEWIDKVFAVMAICPHHTFQVLTKRPGRMLDYLSDPKTQIGIPGVCSSKTNTKIDLNKFFAAAGWPIKNVMLGVTAENQEQADKRIPILLQIPAAKRFVSVEPMLGPVDLEKNISEHCLIKPAAFLDWVICGGESGPGARPMYPDWVRSLRDQCKAAGVPFFFKQWGEYSPFLNRVSNAEIIVCENGDFTDWDSRARGWHQDCKYTHIVMRKVGKKKAGCLLDGGEYKEFPG